jgi:hypothetical protein
MLPSPANHNLFHRDHQDTLHMASKTVLITGCSKGGIGDALAREFRRCGLHVFASARNPDKMQHFADLKIETLVLDVTSKASIKAAVETVRAATDGRLDYLINAAGSCMRFPPSPGFPASNSSPRLCHAATGLRPADGSRLVRHQCFRSYSGYTSLFPTPQERERNGSQHRLHRRRGAARAISRYVSLPENFNCVSGNHHSFLRLTSLLLVLESRFAVNWRYYAH